MHRVQGTLYREEIKLFTNQIGYGIIASTEIDKEMLLKAAFP